MSKVKLTRYIVQALRDENASHVFLVPGGYVDNFSQDLVDVEGIRPIVCATEGGAAMMADGFARGGRGYAHPKLLWFDFLWATDFHGPVSSL